MVEASPSNAGGVSLSPDWRVKITHDSWPKKKLQNIDNRSNVATNSTRTLKMVHIKILKKKKKERNTPYVTPNLHDFHMLLLLPRTSFGSPLLANSYSSFQENAQVPLPTKALFYRSNFIPFLYALIVATKSLSLQQNDAVEDLAFLRASHFSRAQLFSTLWTEAP